MSTSPSRGRRPPGLPTFGGPAERGHAKPFGNVLSDPDPLNFLVFFLSGYYALCSLSSRYARDSYLLPRPRRTKPHREFLRGGAAGVYFLEIFGQNKGMSRRAGIGSLFCSDLSCISGLMDGPISKTMSSHA